MPARESVIASLVRERCGTEALDDMAAPTVRLELAEVRGVGVTTGATSERQSPKNTSPMTHRALDALVLSKQRISRSIVVHRMRAPGSLVVAPRAVTPEARLVGIGVTVRALREGQSLPLVIQVATLTRKTAVRSCQRERRGTVVERYIGKACFQSVALGAVTTELSAVDIDVTRDTTRIVQQVRGRLHARGCVRREVALFTALDVPM
jgi:hypothetical protein